MEWDAAIGRRIAASNHFGGKAVPIYEYQCSKCKGITEKLQGIHDAPLKKCPSCGGKLEKKMSAGAFVLKGAGFYSNDYPHGKSHDSGNGRGTRKPASCPASGGEASPACAGCPSITRESE